MLRVIHISDWHANSFRFIRDIDMEVERINKFGPHAIVMSGDMIANTQFWRNPPIERALQESEWSEMPSYIERILPGIDIVGVRGNHDFLDYKIKGDSASPQSFELHGYKWACMRGIMYIRGNWADEKSEAEIAAMCKLIPDDTQILVTHMPPYGILDIAPDLVPDLNSHTGYKETLVHIGSEALLNRIKSLKDLRLHMFGHSHGDGGKVVEINGVMYSNAAENMNNLVVIP